MNKSLNTNEINYSRSQMLSVIEQVNWLQELSRD